MAKSKTPPPKPPSEFYPPKTPKEQLALLKWCSDNRNIEPWNSWREQNDDTEIHLEGAELRRAHLEGAYLYDAHLNGANLSSAHLEGAILWQAHLEGAELRKAHLEGASFYGSLVDGATSFIDILIDRGTYFSLVNLDACRIYPATKQLLEYNIRRINWEDWYNRLCDKNLSTKIISSPLVPLKWLFVRSFWYISDYGRSTGRIITLFFLFALLFALVYFYSEYSLGVSLVHNLRTDFPADMSVSQARQFFLFFFRPIYFSIVTMTTLGFGDMYAEKYSALGHLLLTLQVLLGYVFLGALITRFAVLFTAGGPAGKFTPLNKQTRQKLKEIKQKHKEKRLELKHELKELEQEHKELEQELKEIEQILNELKAAEEAEEQAKQKLKEIKQKRKERAEQAYKEIEEAQKAKDPDDTDTTDDQKPSETDPS